jgi:nicotinamidase-related amidase
MIIAVEVNANTGVTATANQIGAHAFNVVLVDDDSGAVVGTELFNDADAAVAFAKSCVAESVPAGTFATL